MRLHPRFGLTLALAAIAALLLTAVPLLAQVDVTTGRISGQVVDETGAALPGASVEAKNKDTGLALVAVSDSRGVYRIVSVPVGTYAVTASLQGFGKQTDARVVITLGSAPTVDFKLRLSSKAESVTVTATEAVIETTQTSSQTTIDNNAIRSLPINGRNFTDFVLLAPNAQRETQRGNIAIGGQRGINTSVTLDGVDYNDAFFGGSSGDGSAEGRAPFTVSQESVREFQVIQNGASVEFGRSGGGFVNVVTKSGSNDFHGSAFYYNRPQATTAKFANGTDPRDQKTQQFGASIGGPILKDRLFFFGAWDQQIQSTTVPITSALVTDPDIAARYPKLGQTDPSYIQEQNGKVFFGRLDFQLTDQHRIYGRANSSTYDGPNGTSSSQTQSTSHNGVEGLKTTSLVGSWNAIFSQSTINDFNIQYAKNDIPRGDKGLGLPEIQLTGQATFGEVAFLPIVATDNRISVGDTATFLFGAHAVKVGADYNKTGMDQIFKGNWRGVFVFGTFPGQAATADNLKANLLAGKWTQYREFIGLNGLTVDQAGRFNEDQKELAFFLQDQWYVTPTLTLTAGLRYERLDNPNDPVLDLNKVLAPGAKFVQPDSQIPDANNQWSPRVSLAWSPEKDAKSVVRLSLGRYWSRTPEILFSQLYQSNGVQGTQYVVNANAAGSTGGLPAPGWGAAFDPTKIQQLGNLPPGTTLAAPGVFSIASDFKNPHTDKITFGAEREFFGIAFGVDATWAKGYNLERNSDGNLIPSPAANCPTLDPNSGSPCYGLSPSSSSSNRINPNYGRVTVYTSDARSDYKAMTLSFRKNFAAGFRFFGSLTRSSDYDTDSNERNYSGFTLWDLNNPELNWGPSDRDIKWRGAANASYERQFGNINTFSSVLIAYQTGRPYTAYTGSDNNKDGNTTDRATIDGVVVGRNTYREPDFYTVDVRFGAGYKVGPGTLAVFVDIFNLTNTGNRSTSNTSYGNPGTTPNAAFGTLNGFTTTPRTLQFSGRYDF
jgi:outer membrane receptor protein involved in Fe transport